MYGYSPTYFTTRINARESKIDFLSEDIAHDAYSDFHLNEIVGSDHPDLCKINIQIRTPNKPKKFTILELY